MVSAFAERTVVTVGNALYYLVNPHAWIILRGCICACVLAIDIGFVTTPRVLHVCA